MFRLIFLLATLFSHQVLSQVLKGVVLEGQTNIPLAGAHIYIINSLQGTVSNDAGKFSLTPPDLYGELLITYVGYQNARIEYSPTNTSLEIHLMPVANELNEVNINSTEDKKWKKLYKKFEASFLGDTGNAKSCSIENPWVVDVYKGKNGELLAKSLEPIQIINNALGYKLSFHLNGFSLKGDRLHYEGFVYFDSLLAQDSNEKKRWVINREQTFLGSKRHFLMALDARKLEENGFEAFEAEFSPGIGFVSKQLKHENELVKNSNVLIISDYLKIDYKNEPPQRAFLNTFRNQSSVDFKGPKADLVSQGNMQMSPQITNTQMSYLYSRNSKLIFTKNGLVVNNKNIIEYGYWSWLGVAEMMPYEYRIN